MSEHNDCELANLIIAEILRATEDDDHDAVEAIVTRQPKPVLAHALEHLIEQCKQTVRLADLLCAALIHDRESVDD